MFLELHDISKKYPTPGGEIEVLSNVTLSIDSGECVAVTGPSGSGKSTLLHILGTLESPTDGRVAIAGRDPFAADDDELARFRNQTVGFVFQEHYLLPQFSVRENVLLPTLPFEGGGSRQEQHQRAEVLLERVGLSHRVTHRPAQLSGGERQRVAVARALINKPQLLLCDEPTGSLDHETATSISDLLFELQHSETLALVTVTHSLELAERFPRRLELRSGRCTEL